MVEVLTIIDMVLLMMRSLAKRPPGQTMMMKLGLLGQLIVRPLGMGPLTETIDKN
jgi:hypothetical protein